MTKIVMQKLRKLLSVFLAKSTNRQTAKRADKGFTLLELLIVIAILAVLATIVVLVLNPAETLAKSRDTQRMSDLATMKSAIALYMTTVNPPSLDGQSGGSRNAACKAGSWGAGDKIYYSIDSTAATLNDTTLDGGSASVPAHLQVSAAALTLVDGTGWIPVAFSGITGGSPLSNLPIDPTNTVSSVTAIVNTDLVYRYACYSSGSVLAFEIDAVLESEEYKTTQLKMAKDGGNDADYYEIGTKLDILGAGTNDF